MSFKIAVLKKQDVLQKTKWKIKHPICKFHSNTFNTILYLLNSYLSSLKHQF